MNTVKVFQLGEESFQVTCPKGRTYVGTFQFLHDCAFLDGFKLGEIVPLAGIKTANYSNCYHDWIDVGFRFNNFVCRHCDVQKD